MKTRFLAGLILLSIASGMHGAPVELVPAESVGMSTEKLLFLKKRLQQEINEQVTGGIQVLVARYGKIVLYENLGYSNVEARVPVNEETLFRVFSMTKPIVGVAMMMLYEEGRFSMTDPLAMHAPQFADLEVFAGLNDNGKLLLESPEREPTIQDLMLHTAGFTYGSFGDTAIDKLYVDQRISPMRQPLEEFIDVLAETPLLYQPGTQWVYSVAVDVQGYLIKKWTGMEPAEYLRSRILDPLGMDQTYAWMPEGPAGRLASIYTHNDEDQLVPYEGYQTTLHVKTPGVFSGGSQFLSTADDYWRFAQMLLNGGEFEGVRYLSPKTIDMMTADRLPVGAETRTQGVGFGLNIAVINEPSLIPYPASAGEYYWYGLANTVFWVDPKEELIAIMLTQYLPFNGRYFRNLMHRLVYAAVTERG